MRALVSNVCFAITKTRTEMLCPDDNQQPMSSNACGYSTFSNYMLDTFLSIMHWISHYLPFAFYIDYLNKF